MFRWLHRFYRAVYRVNRASRTMEAWGSRKPRRIARLYERRLAYRGFARLINRLLK